MNWALHPYLYQTIHPWHWLTYGQNAAAIGLIGLALYTYFTYRLLRHSQETERAKLFPYLVLQNDEENGHLKSIIVQNIGGPATNIFYWLQPVSEKFALLDDTILIASTGVFRQFEGTMAPLSRKKIDVTPEKSGLRYLYVFDMKDMAGGDHQMAFIRTRNSDNSDVSTHVQMIHRDMDPSPISRLRRKIREYQAKRRVSKK